MKDFALAGGGMAQVLRPYWQTFFRQPWRAFAVILSINIILLAVILALQFGYGVDHWNLIRDTNAIAGQPSYFGSYSSLGVLVWAAASAVSLFAWRCLIRRGIHNNYTRALGLGGLFTGIACLDDLFMLHEHAYVIGIPETVVLAGYGVFLLAFVASTLPILHATRWLFLVAALGCLALSTMFDLVQFPGSVLLEEVFKLSGVSFLAAYLISLSLTAVAGASPRQA